MDSFIPCESRPDFHSVYTITLAELVEDGIFSWSRKPLANCLAGLDGIDKGIKSRIQDMFVERNYWREISMEPYLQWAQQIAYKMKFELVPKYKPLYKAIKEGDFDPLHIGDEYFKERHIDSEFPETLLSGNGADYASRGYDREYQKINTGNALEIAEAYYSTYQNVDTAFVSELDSFFIDLWSANANLL